LDTADTGGLPGSGNARDPTAHGRGIAIFFGWGEGATVGNEGEGEEVGEVGVGHFRGRGCGIGWGLCGCSWIGTLVFKGGEGKLVFRIAAVHVERFFCKAGWGLVHIIQHQLGFIQVIRPTLKSGDAQRFCSVTAGMAMAGGVCVVDCDCVFVIQGADLPLWHGFKGSILVGSGF